MLFFSPLPIPPIPSSPSPPAPLQFQKKTQSPSFFFPKNFPRQGAIFARAGKGGTEIPSPVDGARASELTCWRGEGGRKMGFGGGGGEVRGVGGEKRGGEGWFRLNKCFSICYKKKKGLIRITEGVYFFFKKKHGIKNTIE